MNSYDPKTGESLVFDQEGASLFLTVPENTLRAGRVTGQVWSVPAPKYIKIGSRIRYKKSDLIEWLEQFPSIRNTSEEKWEGHHHEV